MSSSTSSTDDAYNGDSNPASIQSHTVHRLKTVERDVRSISSGLFKMQKEVEKMQLKIAIMTTARTAKQEEKKLLLEVMAIYKRHEKPKFNPPPRSPSTFNVTFVGKVPNGTPTKTNYAAPVRDFVQKKNSSNVASGSTSMPSLHDEAYPSGPSGQLDMYKDILVRTYPAGSSGAPAGSYEIPNFGSLTKKKRKRALKKLAKKLILESRNPKSPPTPSNGTKRNRSNGSSSSSSSGSAKRQRFNRPL